MGQAEIALQDRLRVAVNACLPILNHGIDAYDEWATLIVYPDEFLVDKEEKDEAVVVPCGRRLRAGESWKHWPMVISRGDVQGQPAREGYNVVIHECAQKLDMRNGASDGFPLLHRDMSVRDWAGAGFRGGGRAQIPWLPVDDPLASFEEGVDFA